MRRTTLDYNSCWQILPRTHCLVKFRTSPSLSERLVFVGRFPTGEQAELKPTLCAAVYRHVFEGEDFHQPPGPWRSYKGECGGSR